MIAKISGKVRSVPPWMWLLAIMVLGVLYLAYDKFLRDESDEDWTTPKEMQPPVQVRGIPAHGSGRPMACGGAFRSRSYPATLIDAEFSVIGDC